MSIARFSHCAVLLPVFAVWSWCHAPEARAHEAAGGDVRIVSIVDTRGDPAVLPRNCEITVAMYS